MEKLKFARFTSTAKLFPLYVPTKTAYSISHTMSLLTNTNETNMGIPNGFLVCRNPYDILVYLELQQVINVG